MRTATWNAPKPLGEPVKQPQAVDSNGVLVALLEHDAHPPFGECLLLRLHALHHLGLRPRDRLRKAASSVRETHVIVRLERRERKFGRARGGVQLLSGRDG